MLPKFLNSIIRIAGLLISIILIIQPWLIATHTADPFLYSGWAHFLAGFLSLICSCLLLTIYRPKTGYVTSNSGLLILFAAISIALYNTPYNVCLRFSLLSLGLIASVWTLRLLRKSQDNFSIGGMISLSGFFMAVYAICQATGHDFLIWESKYKIVGTLSNPNFLGIFLCMTSCITFGMFSEIFSHNKKQGYVFLLFFLVQTAVLIMLHRPGHLICLIFMITIWFWARWFKYSGKISKKTPILAGLILAIILLACQWLIYSSTSQYEWEKITKVSDNSQTIVSRLILWQMGFDIFLNHKYTGAGCGAVSYIMPLQRPNIGSTLGLNIYNDDPHSFIVTTLSETGFLGLLGISILLVSFYGCYIRKNTKYEPVEFITNDTSKVPEENTQENNNPKEKIDVSNTDTTTPAETIAQEEKSADEMPCTIKQVKFPWFYTSIAVLILYLSFQSGFIKSFYIPIAISAIILFFGICTSIINNNYQQTQNDFRYLGRSTLTAILTFAFYSLFNNSFSILPLTGFLALIASLHYSCCQNDIKWQPRITVISLLYILIPAVYVFSAYNSQIDYQQEQNTFNEGAVALSEGRWQDAEQNLKNVIKKNPQCLKAYYGLALALDAQQQPDQAQEVLLKLDAMVPNIFNAKYEIARILFENNKILEAHRYAIKNLEWTEDPLAYEMLGKILLVEGRFNEAEQIFKESLISIPVSVKERLAADRIRLSLAALASQRGDFKNCSTYLDAIKTEVAKNIDAMYLRGMLLTRDKKYDEALKIFNEALLEYPHVPRILNAAGYLLLETNQDLDRAQVLLEEAYQLALEKQPRELSEMLMIANSLGKLYAKQKKMKQAGDLLRISYEETPDEWGTLKQERKNDLENFFNSFQAAE